MSKSKRLMELMMAVNRKRKFTVKELAGEFNVSSRTVLRDLQELSELGVPLYSEVGPHGGYRVLNDRVLPPIAFTEEEAVSIFFASHALRHYPFLPFDAESSAALNKFYMYMPGDVRTRIDQIRNRVDIYTPARRLSPAFLSRLLEAAIAQQVLRIEYAARGGATVREVQPVGIYASNGLWYCPAYCFLRGDFRVFRCDRLLAVGAASAEVMPLDHRHVHLGNWMAYCKEEIVYLDLHVELSREGVLACEADAWLAPMLKLHEDGSGLLQGAMPKGEISYLAHFFISLGSEATVIEPPELLSAIRNMLNELLLKYGL